MKAAIAAAAAAGILPAAATPGLLLPSIPLPDLLLTTGPRAAPCRRSAGVSCTPGAWRALGSWAMAGGRPSRSACPR